MSLKEIKQIKTNKYFTRADLIIYIVLILFIIIVSVFFSFSAFRAEKPDFLEIRYRNELIGRYDFNEKKLTAEAGCDVFFKTEREVDGVFLIHIYPSEGEYNLLQVNISERTADMKETNCSQSKDCIYMHIRRSGQNIICVPHGLVIEGVSARGNDNGVIIG